jgi:hypothetical protein
VHLRFDDGLQYFGCLPSLKRDFDQTGVGDHFLGDNGIPTSFDEKTASLHLLTASRSAAADNTGTSRGTIVWTPQFAYPFNCIKSGNSFRCPATEPETRPRCHLRKKGYGL